MSFIDEVEEAESKARLRRAAPAAALGVAALVLAVLFFALQGMFGGGQFVVESASSSSVAADAGAGSGSGSEAGSSGSAAGAPEAAGEACVYVTGAVKRPGVYTLAATARVNDAIKKAGGFTAQADKSSLNLARVLVDGEQIQVMTKAQAKAAQGGAAASGSTAAASGSAGASGSAAGAAAASGKVNINTAGMEELKTLDGIGEVTAQKIIDYRDASGPFAKPEDLKNVSGIGDKKYAAVADRICV